MIRRGVVAGLFLLAACGSAPEEEAPVAKPTGYYVRQVDLYQDPPHDVCRTLDREFILELLSRAMQALPVEAAGSQRFEDFDAPSGFDGKGDKAVLRFTARHGTETVMFSATGSFDRKSCAVGPMAVGIGAYPFDPQWQELKGKKP